MNEWAQTLLLWSWQSLLLVGFVLVVVRIARSHSAASRHSFWLLAVLVISVLPVVNVIVRALPVEAPAVAPIRYIAQLPAVTVETSPAAVQSPDSARDFVTPLLFTIWIAGVLITAVRSVREHRRWRRIVRSVGYVEKTGRSIPVGYSAEVETPILVGTLRPVIVLPADIEVWTTAEERRAVLRHELAHVERHDHWVSPVQVFLRTVFFFHPAVRYALRQLVLERELACDERVLSVGVSPSSYAEVILKVAEHSISGRRSDCPAFASPAMILERRIKMILSHSSPVSERWEVPVIGRAAIVLALASLLLPQSATLAEIPAPPRLEIRAAALQPLMESVSVIATAVATPLAQAPQNAFATISGSVFDPSGALVPSVNVTLTAIGQEPRTTTTNQEGAYAVDRIVPGEWTLQVRLPGFTNVDRRINLRPGEGGVENVSLAVRGVSTQVNVTASRSALPPNPVNATPPKRIGGLIVQARLLTQVKPVYPATARALGIQDYVQLQAVIGRDGTLLSLQIDPNRVGVGNTDLNQAAMDAVRQWRYSPSTLNGMPIETATTITVNFTLE